MGKTLNEIILLNDNLTGCLPCEIGQLEELTVFDVSLNAIFGPIPRTISGMRSLEELDVSNNQLTGTVPDAACLLPNLHNFTYAFNFFTNEDSSCVSSGDGRFNCINGKAMQRTPEECTSAEAKPVDCRIFKCYTPPPSPPSPHPSYSYPPVAYKSPSSPPPSAYYYPETYPSPPPSDKSCPPAPYSSPQEYSPETSTPSYEPSYYASPSPPALPYN